MTMATMLDAALLIPLPLNSIARKLREEPPHCQHCRMLLSQGVEVEDELLPDGALCCDFCTALVCTKTRCLDRTRKQAPLDVSSYAVRHRYGWACPNCWADSLVKVPVFLSFFLVCGIPV